MKGQKLRLWIGRTAARSWEAKWLFPIILGFLVSVLDPFGFSSATDQRSHAVFNRVAAPFYEPKGYNHISVVLVDDDYLKAMNDTYPMSRYNFLDIHAALTSAQPEAIFYDFHLPAERGDRDATLLLGSEIAASASNPKQDPGDREIARRPFVWFADFGGDEDSQRKYDLHGQVRTLPVRTVGVPIGEYAPCQSALGDAARCGTVGSRRSPALEIYRAVCGRMGSGACAEGGMSGTMVLQWSRKPEPGRTKCSEDPDTVLGDAMLAARVLWSGLFEKGRQNPRTAQVCYPFQTVRAVDLESMSEAALSAAFDGQIVMVGGMFGDAPDTSLSPVHGQIPGVFVHATALENFITYGNRYWRADHRVSAAPLGIKHLLEFLALFAASLVYRQANLRERRQQQAAEALAPDDRQEVVIAFARMSSATLSLILQIAVLVGFALAVPLIFSMPPTNFYGLCALTVPLMATIWIFSWSNWFMVSLEKGLLRHIVEAVTLPRILLLLLLTAVAGMFALFGPWRDSTIEGFQWPDFMVNFF